MNTVRVWGNQKYVDFKVWKARRQAYRQRTLVVSNHWDGSVQVFYHFLLGYFAPLTLWLERTGTKSIAVRDCGPMNHWFELLKPGIDVQIVKPGVALHTLAGNRSRHHVVQGMDYPQRHKSRLLIRARNSMLSYIPETQIPVTPILVIDRASSDDYHSGSLSETEMSGARRRSVPNLQSICEEILVKGTYSVVDMAHISPESQVGLARNSQILVGQHGAGLTHMIWMPTGSTVIEIHPPLPDEAIDVFRQLAQALGHCYIRIPQANVHAEIESQDLIETFSQSHSNYLA